MYNRIIYLIASCITFLSLTSCYVGNQFSDVGDILDEEYGWRENMPWWFQLLIIVIFWVIVFVIYKVWNMPVNNDKKYDDYDSEFDD